MLRCRTGDRKQCLRFQTQGLTAEPSDARENFLQFLEGKINTNNTLIYFNQLCPHLLKVISDYLQGQEVKSQSVTPWSAVMSAAAVLMGGLLQVSLRDSQVVLRVGKAW